MRQNLHHVYLNVEAAWVASLHVPPSDVEQKLEDIGAACWRRPARFLARNMWVLWEAWDRRPRYHDAFADRGPSHVAKLRELEAVGNSAAGSRRLAESATT
jgi:hypothetical protein